MSNVSEFLKELEALNAIDNHSIVIPSQNKAVKFKPISAQQHKDILNSVIGGVIGQLKLQCVIINILRNNIEETSLDLTAYDKSFIITQLRKFSLGNNVLINNTTYSLDSLPKYTFNYPTTKCIEYNNISVEVAIPTINTELNITNALITNLSTKSTSDDQKTQELVSTLLEYEIAKFIKTITIGKNVVNTSNNSLADMLAIINHLPLKINNDIINYIAGYKTHEQSLLTFSDGAELVIDASFLTNA